MDRNRWIGVILFCATIPTFLIPFVFGGIRNLFDLITALVAGGIVALIVTGSAFLYRGSKTKSTLDTIKGSQEAKLKPRLNITWRVWHKDHPLHSALSNAYILTLKVENVGGGQMAESCSAYINIEGIIDFEDALNWLYRGSNQIFAPVVRLDHLELRNIEVQTNYAKNWNVPIKKGSASAEHVDILFTQKDGNIAYLLDAEHKTLEMNKRYSLTATIVAKDLNPKKVNMTIAIPNRNNIKVEEFHVI